jgi:hypothetical protein
MLFKFQSSFKQAIQGAPPARIKKKLKSNLSKGYMAGLKAGGNFQGSLNLMAYKRNPVEKYGPTFQPPLYTQLLRKLHERPSRSGEFYGTKDLVRANNFEYAKSLADKRLPQFTPGIIRKIYRDQERDRGNWRKSVSSRSGMIDLKQGISGIIKEHFYDDEQRYEVVYGRTERLANEKVCSLQVRSFTHKTRRFHLQPTARRQSRRILQKPQPTAVVVETCLETLRIEDSRNNILRIDASL